MNENKKLVQHLIVILSLTINQILFLADVDPQHTISLRSLEFTQQILFISAIIAKGAFAAFRIYSENKFNRVIQLTDMISFVKADKNNLYEWIMLNILFTIDSSISISKFKLKLVILLNSYEYEFISINQVMFQVLYTCFNFILIPRRIIYKFQKQIRYFKMIIVFSQCFLATFYLRLMLYPETIRNTVLFPLLILIFILNEINPEDQTQSTQGSKFNIVKQIGGSSSKQSFQQFSVSQNENQTQQNNQIDQNIQFLKTPCIQIGNSCDSKEKSASHYKADRDTILMDILEIGYIWFDSSGYIVHTNRVMENDIFAKFGISQMSFTSLYEIKKLDPLTSDILSLNLSQNVSKFSEMNESINLQKKSKRKSEFKKPHSLQYLTECNIKIQSGQKVCLKDLLHDLSNLKDIMLNHQILILESELNGNQLKDYQICLKTVNNQNSKTAKLSFILSFIKSKQLDDYKMVQYTYKIMRQLFRTFSHEFGTSLNYLLAMTQTAEESQDIPLKIRDNFFKPITRQGKLMHCVVSDMLDYNQILGKEFKVQLGPIKIKEILDEVKDIFEEIFNIKNIVLQVQMRDMINTTEIISDRQRIKQILVNLLSNCQKFTYQGQVNVIANWFQEGENKYIVFTVEDTGIGMSEEEKQRLQRFLQKGVKEELQVSQNTVGFGFGVFISNQLAVMLSKRKLSDDGGLCFKSQMAVGSTFSFMVLDFQVNWVDSSYTASPYINIDRRSFLDLRQSQIQSGFSKHSHSVLQFSRQNIQSKRTFQVSSYIRKILQIGLSPTKSKQNQSNLNSQHFTSIVQLRDIEESEEYLTIGQEHEHRNKIQQIKFFEQKEVKQKIMFTEVEQFYAMNRGLVESQKMLCQCAKILVVDDEVVNIMAIKMMLNRYDLICDHALNGRICLDKLIQYRGNKCPCGRRNYQLIFMDINMSVLDGYETTKQINEMAQNVDFEKPIIVACTAFVDMETKTKCYDLHMDYFLSKPLRKKELEGTLRYYDLID